MGNLQFKDHIEHAIRAIGLQQLHNVGVLEHVTDAGLTLQVWKGNVLTHSTQNQYSNIITADFYVITQDQSVLI